MFLDHESLEKNIIIRVDGRVLWIKSVTSLQLQVELATFHQLWVKSAMNPVINNFQSVTSFVACIFCLFVFSKIIISHVEFMTLIRTRNVEVRYLELERNKNGTGMQCSVIMIKMTVWQKRNGNFLMTATVLWQKLIMLQSASPKLYSFVQL